MKLKTEEIKRIRVEIEEIHSRYPVDLFDPRTMQN